jgi:hypothetical protein
MIHEIGLKILQNCKNDLEVETFLTAIGPYHDEFKSIIILSGSGANGVQLRLALLAQICMANEDIIISANQLKEVSLLLGNGDN